METSNDEIQTREIYRPGRDEVAMTKIQTRKIHRPGTDVDATKSATSNTRANTTHRTSTEQSRPHQRGSTGDGATRHAAQ